LFLFFGQKKAAFHIGIDINIDRGHTGRFKTDHPAAVRIFLFIGDIKMLARKTIDVLDPVIAIVCHRLNPEIILRRLSLEVSVCFINNLTVIKIVHKTAHSCSEPFYDHATTHYTAKAKLARF
jgi:hypothetical protein